MVNDIVPQQRQWGRAREDYGAGHDTFPRDVRRTLEGRRTEVPR